MSNKIPITIGILIGLLVTLIIWKQADIEIQPAMQRPVKPNEEKHMSQPQVHTYINLGKLKVIMHNLAGDSKIELITGTGTSTDKVHYYLNDGWKEYAVSKGYVVDKNSKPIPDNKLGQWSEKMRKGLKNTYIYLIQEWRGKAYLWNKLYPEDIIVDKALPPKEDVIGGFLYE